jgi:hypothetical protein
MDCKKRSGGYGRKRWYQKNRDHRCRWIGAAAVLPLNHLAQSFMAEIRA